CDLDPRALRGHRDLQAVLRDDLDDEALAVVGEKVLVARVGPQVDVDVAVKGFELDLVDSADRYPAAALHSQPLRVVDAGQRVAAATVGRGERDLAPEAARGCAAGEEEGENDGRAAHPSRVPAPGCARKSLFRTRLESSATRT